MLESAAVLCHGEMGILTLMAQRGCNEMPFVTGSLVHYVLFVMSSSKKERSGKECWYILYSASQLK